MATRRNFIKTGGAAAALLGTMGLAGCSSVENALGGGGGGGTSYSSWLYDPEEVMDTSFEMFGTFSVQDLYENEDDIPDEVFDQLDEANDDLSEVGIDLEETSAMTAAAFVEEDFSFTRANQVGGGGSVAVSGTFEVDELEDRIEQNNETMSEEQQLEEEDDYEGYTIYVSQYEQEMVNGETRTQSAALAISESNIVSGGMATNDAEAIDAVETMIDANNGNAPQWTNENDNANEMINQLGSNTMAMGSTTPDIDTYVGELTGAAANSEDETTQEAAELANDIADNMVSLGMAMEIQGEEYETRFAMVYEEGDDAETGPYEDMIDLIEENNESEVEEPLENVEVSKNGRTIMVTTTGETETLFENAQESAGGSASASGSASSSDGGGDGDSDYAIGFPVDVATMQVVSLGDIVGAPLSEGGVDVGF